MKGKVPTGVTTGVLRLLKHGSRVQLEALAKLCDRDEGFDDRALLLKARRRLHKVLVRAYKARKATKEEDLDGILVLVQAYMWVDKGDKCKACFERAKEGFVRLLGEDSAKAVTTAFRVAGQLPTLDEINCGVHAALEDGEGFSTRRGYHVQHRKPSGASVVWEVAVRREYTRIHKKIQENKSSKNPLFYKQN